MNEWQQDVKAFQERFGKPVNKQPGKVEESYKNLCKHLIEEEAKEVLEALDEQDPVHIAKELCDLVYVAMYAANAFGINLDPIYREVHRTNMQKVGGATREDGKILKPEGWQPPNIQRFIDAQTIRK